MEGVHTVILAFDCYTYSPAAKGPTQAKRKQGSEVPSWTELQRLPNVIPANYSTLLFNRNFKKRVITSVIDQLLVQCRVVRPGQKVIIDYEDNPYVLIGEGASRAATASSPAVLTTEFEVACGLGESDVKWVR
jgi:hypothetical protein